MHLDPHALQVATETLDQLLCAEADEQRAYLVHFPDGRISLELEWIDMRPMIEAVIATYLAHVTNSRLQDVADTDRSIGRSVAP